jgi:hypothetical protein
MSTTAQAGRIHVPARVRTRAISAGTLALMSLGLIGAASVIAALAGHTMIAWWTIACIVPLVTPVAFLYAAELAYWSGILIVPVMAGIGIAVGLAAIARAAASLDDL